MATAKHRTNPFIPKTVHKQEFVQELTHDPPQQPHTMMKPDYPIRVPNFNILYDSYGTKQGWRYSADAYASGSVTTVAGSSVNSAVTLQEVANTQGSIWNLQRWPDGTQVFLVVRVFSEGPTTATFATQGAISILFIDQFGNTAPLGVAPNNGFYTFTADTIMPGSITDPGQQVNLGNLVFSLNAGATVGTYNWQLGLSAAYLLPAKKGFHIERWNEHADWHHHRND